MNYLAHACLAGDDPVFVLGNLAGDWVKGHLEALPPSRFVDGLRMHRQVDVFVDAHPAWRRSRDRFDHTRRRFAGIVVDVAYDHFLARDWERRAPLPVPLGIYTATLYGWMAAHEALLPADFVPVTRRMAETDWLGGYADRQATGYAVERISRRLRRGAGLAACVQDLEAHYADLAADFADLWPDLLAYARHLRLRAGLA